MNKSLLTIASLALMVTLAGCPGGNPSQPNPSSNPSETPSVTPSETPATTEPGSSSNPGTTPVATPTPITDALPTPVPGNTSLTLTAASAVKQSDFSYVFTITGTGLGTIADYSTLQVEASDSTVILVRNGVSQHNGIEIKEAVSVTPSSITFRWLPPNGAPTNNDLVKLTYTKMGSNQQISTDVRMAVSN